MDVMKAEYWQVTGAGGCWWVDSSAAAALAADRGFAVKLVSVLDAAYKLAHRTLRVEPWVIKTGLRKADGSKARALVCLCLRTVGWSERAIAEAMELSASSVHDAMDAYWDDKDVVEALRAWAESRSETLMFNVINRAPEPGTAEGVGV